MRREEEEINQRNKQLQTKSETPDKKQEERQITEQATPVNTTSLPTKTVTRRRTKGGKAKNPREEFCHRQPKGLRKWINIKARTFSGRK